jgi:hypothetical protein
MKTSIPPVLITIALVCFALSPKAQAVSPAPDGGYAGGNTAEGQAALLSLTTGGFNTGIGFFSLRSNTTGQFNTAVGAGTLLANTGDENAATGAGALLSNTTGNFNTANGAFALFSNTTAIQNTANGSQALFSNTTGGNNTATGFRALISNTTADANTANGSQALFHNTTGNLNTASGFDALLNNTIGSDNTANGEGALFSNTIGSDNTANGEGALFSNTTGIDNTASGVQALLNNTTGSDNTAIGFGALFNNSTGTGNIALGEAAGLNLTTGNENIDIGNIGGVAESSTIRIGGAQTRAFIAGIRGVITGNNNAVPVLIDSNGQLGTASSSRRFKKEIKPMDQTSEAILALKPVMFHYKSDSTGTPQFGLIAEEVAEVNPDLVVRDNSGEIYTVRYDAVNAMLLNEFLKEHKAFIEEQRKVQEQEATITQLKQDFQSRIAHQQKQIEALTAGLQKVNVQVEANKPAPQVVNNP